MAVILPKSVFIHTPKTGGNWVETVLGKCGLIVHNTRGMGFAHAIHSDLPVLGHSAAAQLPSFTFVRHPASWWRSYWAFKMRNGWDAPNPIDETCKDPSFEGFIRKVLEHYPGLLAKDFRRYTQGVTYVGRTESLCTDLMSILLKIGEPFDPAILQTAPPENVTGSHLVGYTKELFAAIVESEREAIEEWGYGLHGYGKV